MIHRPDATQIESLAEFYRAWPELRVHALEIGLHTDLSAAEQAVLKWMILLTDRVGPADLDLN